MSQATQPESDALPFHHFDESISLEDPTPVSSWQPSPAQIDRWSPEIRDAPDKCKGSKT